MVTDYDRYYTHYPLDKNTFPKSKELGLLEIAPYDNRTMVEGNSIRTWRTDYKAAAGKAGG